MHSSKGKKGKYLLKVSSGSESDGNEHELSYYTKDKVRLMKEVLKLIKPKKIKSMAPECIKHLDIVEINSMLLEELLGISTKRLMYVFNGENVDRETSSSDSEEEKPIDVISLDDISDDEIEFTNETCSETASPSKAKASKKFKQLVKTENKKKTFKKEKENKGSLKTKSNEPKSNEENPNSEKEKLMSVLELLELQARARAIRSQLAIENEKKKEEIAESSTSIKLEDDSDSDAIIIESPKHKEIVITSDSENEVPNSSTSKINCVSNNETAVASQTEEMQSDTEENSVTIIVDNQNSPSRNDKKKQKDVAEHKKRQNFLAKVQKVKKSRNKAKAQTIASGKSSVKEIRKESKEDNLSIAVRLEDISLPPDNDMENNNISNTILNVSEENIVTETTRSEIENSSTNQANAGDTIAQEMPNNQQEGLEVNIHEEEQQNTEKAKNRTDCDNDEIVINLDDDEIDIMEHG